MNNETLLYIIAGAMVGASVGSLLGTLTLIFFDDKIFRALDWLRATVRRIFRRIFLGA